VTSHDKGHGRIETRTLTTTSAREVDWPGAKQVCTIERTIEHGKEGSCSFERVYAITSLPASEIGARALLTLARAHWSIETRLHYVRDVTLGEDACQTHRGHAPQALAATRNTVIALLHLSGVKNIAAALRRFAAHVHEALALVGIRECPH
jgi:predicted transposase YbfD/YdcC